MRELTFKDAHPDIKRMTFDTVVGIANQYANVLDSIARVETVYSSTDPFIRVIGYRVESSQPIVELDFSQGSILTADLIDTTSQHVRRPQTLEELVFAFRDSLSYQFGFTTI